MHEYLISLATFGCIYALLGIGLNLVWGMTGLINLGIAGFYAVGAYGAAIAATQAGLPLPVNFVVAFVVAALAGAAVAVSTGRLRDDYLAIVTLGFAEVTRLVANNEKWLTGGPDGISGIGNSFRAKMEGNFNLAYLGLALAMVLVVYVVAEIVRRAPYGRVLRAIRDDERGAAVAGKNVLRFKVQVLAIGAGICGLAGAVYANYTSYINPENFVPLVAIYVFLALVAGGVGNNLGAIVGAFTLVALLESTRYLQDVVHFLSGVQLAALREMLIGGLLLVVMRYWSRGLVPERTIALAPPPKPGKDADAATGDS